MTVESKFAVPENYSREFNVNQIDVSVPILPTEVFDYGTAGIRTLAEKLTFVAFRCAIGAALRAKTKDQAIGLMITASHNPACDNGVKIVDPQGEMLEQSYERVIMDLVNCSDAEFVQKMETSEIRSIIITTSGSAKIICGIDTRSSGPHLSRAAQAAVKLVGATFVDCGVVTTPQLHFIVKCTNCPSFGEPTETGYYKSLSESFNELYEITHEPEQSNYSNVLVLDCANGVGAPKMRLLANALGRRLSINYRNENGVLNFDCGADFVKLYQSLPQNISCKEKAPKCASFDGDADRLVYYRSKSEANNEIALLDGDKIALLIAKYVRELMKSAGVEDLLTLGIVQTAYANGNSARYIEEFLKVKRECVPTGVKNLHHAAVKYDIGIYFEANGHGTIVFSSKFDEVVRKNPKEKLAMKKLQLFSRVINEVVGDALADLLAVEIILRHYGWSLDDWIEKLYTDLPNVQLKIAVPNRSIYKTTWEETTVLEPEGLQRKIDDEVKKYSKARAFVRPSGTENIVRVYAEAENSSDAGELAYRISKFV